MVQKLLALEMHLNRFNFFSCRNAEPVHTGNRAARRPRRVLPCRRGLPCRGALSIGRCCLPFWWVGASAGAPPSIRSGVYIEQSNCPRPVRLHLPIMAAATANCPSCVFDQLLWRVRVVSFVYRCFPATASKFHWMAERAL